MAVVKDFKCPNCGASLTNLYSPTGICSFCSSPYVIEGLKNILSEGIQGGTAFTATADMLHDKIIEILSSNRSAPVDVFDNTVIESCENFSVPSYYCHYNGTSDYMCEIGSVNKVHVYNGSSTKQVRETHWSAVTGNTRAELECIVSGNSEYDHVINDIYNPYRGSIFLNVENLTFEPDAYNVSYNRPEGVLLDTFVRPAMEKALAESVEKQLDGKNYRNLSTGNINIEKDGTVDKVIVGVYHIVLSHNGKRFDIYTTADGVGAKCEEMPNDTNREGSINELEDIDKKVTAALKTAKIILAVGILAVLLFHRKPLILTVSSLASMFEGYNIYNQSNKLKDIKQKIEEFNKVVPDLLGKFLIEKKKLDGAEKLLELK